MFEKVVRCSFLLFVLMSIMLAPTVIEKSINPGIKINKKCHASIGKVSVKYGFFLGTLFIPIDGGTSGSGFFFDQNKPLLITNYHVIKTDNSFLQPYAYFFEDEYGDVYVAKVATFSEKLDLACLEVRIGEWKPLKIGDPKRLKIGESVYAISSPLGLINTMTDGIVSALNQHIGDLIDEEKYGKIGLIQTNCQISHGSSGSPLLNSDGEVVGVNTLTLDGSRGVSGIYFAIPIDAWNFIPKPKNILFECLF